jgi:hypothetical protein
MENPHVTLDNFESAARRASVLNAVAITEMEGGRPSAYCREQLGLFEAGEMRDRVVRHAMRKLIDGFGGA